MNTQSTQNIQSAKDAGLRYVVERYDGILRRRQGKGFRFIYSTGKPVKDAQTLSRIRSLVIPPAWEDVWICRDPRGHIQAVGQDQRGRKQYIYHPRWRQVRDENKYERLIDFARALPGIRRRVNREMRRPGLGREKVLATVVSLLEHSLIRVGNEECAKANDSIGLTTMRNKHVKVNGGTIHFEFRGKSGVEHAIDLHDRRLAKIIKSCQDLPGYELFQYVDSDGTRRAIGSDDVNEFLHTIAGEEFTAKDFRTWAGTVLAAQSLMEFKRADSETETKRNIVAVIDTVAKKLGNTRSVCRKCYIHPKIFEAYGNGTLIRQSSRRSSPALHQNEIAVFDLLNAALTRDSKRRRAA